MGKLGFCPALGVPHLGEFYSREALKRLGCGAQIFHGSLITWVFLFQDKFSEDPQENRTKLSSAFFFGIVHKYIRNSVVKQYYVFIGTSYMLPVLRLGLKPRERSTRFGLGSQGMEMDGYLSHVNGSEQQCFFFPSFLKFI